MTPPKRQRSRWRPVALAIVGLLLATVASHAIWSMRARRAVDAYVADLHAAGEPIYPTDFDAPPPPPGQNAADDILAAAAAAARRSPTSAKFDALDLALPFTDAEAEVINAESLACREAFDHVDAAAGKPAVYWAFDPTQPTMFQDAPGLHTVRRLASLLRADALLAHHEGDERGALTRIEQIAMLARAVDAQRTVVAHLVGVGLDAVASEAAGQVACDLRIGGDDGAPPARVRALVDALADDAPTRRGMANALRGERKDQWLALTQTLDGTMKYQPSPAAQEKQWPASMAYVTKPLVLGDAALLLRLMTATLREFEGAKDFPAYAARTESPRLLKEIDDSPKLHLMARLLAAPSYERVVRHQFHVIVDRHLVAAALALRAYQADHDGRLPASLDELVPKYIAAVPLDPMTPGPQPLRYKPAGDDPIVYATGDDGVDDGGSDQPARPRPPGLTRPDRWLCRDAVVHLKRQPRDAPPAPAPPQR